MKVFAALLLSLLLVVPSAGAQEPAPSAPRAMLDPFFARDLERLKGSTRYGAFVHFRTSDGATQREVVQDAGLEIASRYATIDVVFAVGTLDKVAALAASPQVSYLEADRPLEYLGDTAKWATRAEVARNAVLDGPYRDGSGRFLDGSGVGIAVVDGGVDTTHPDLAERVGKNYDVVCSTPALINVNTGMCFGPYTVVETPHSDPDGGHGTHVSGIALGDGRASEGTYQGVAPGATLFGYGVGKVITIYANVEAFDHILQNYNSFVPRIRVINNSYGDTNGTPYDPQSVFSKLVNQLVAKGVTIVFAAGNGGSGTGDRTSSFSKNPTPGVISVASYDDADTGTRRGQVASTSSRGLNTAPNTHPDISAPGARIVSTCRPNLPVCHLGLPAAQVGWAPNYASISGTSMAAPHVSGAVALLLQAKPDLTPAGIEKLMQDTAHKFTSGGAYQSDPQNPGGTTSFDKGAGLLDVHAALKGAGAQGSPPAQGTHVLVADDGGDLPTPAANDIVSVTATEGAEGMTYEIEVADISDQGPLYYPIYRLHQTIEGRVSVTDVRMSANGIVAGEHDATTNNAVATQVSVTGDTIRFFVPFASLGNPSSGSNAYNVFVRSINGTDVDVAPGGIGQSHALQPRFGDPYTIWRGTSPNPTPSPTPTVTPTSSPSPTPTGAEPQTTELRFTNSTPGKGQYSDHTVFEARLSGPGDAAVTDRTVTFTLERARSTRSFLVGTDQNGVARISPKLTERPGLYQLSASFSGDGTFRASEDSTSFKVVKERVVLHLTMKRKGQQRIVHARLLDEDDRRGIGGRKIVFSAGKKKLGSKATSRKGVAKRTLPKRLYRTRPLKAAFRGDAFYVAKRATIKR